MAKLNYVIALKMRCETLNTERIKSFYRPLAAVIQKQHFVYKQSRMIRRAKVLGCVPHIHACAISAIMCQIKRYKDSTGKMSNRMPEIIHAFDVPADVCYATRRVNAVTLNRKITF